MPIPRYTLADSTPITTDNLDATATWEATSTLPTGNGPIRLRFHLSAGDLYAYAIT
ncbi:hypothetical protein [Micromonospora craterilacus]|uniref:hypothetical protein n=1 Tax=Micromonospora craterilacus TaxID=1655439 RepID=UPI00131460FF|nr:hypothetical protein [Micromonospora craterilacus]